MELVAGATLTSQGVIDAAAQALEQAGGEFTPPDPEPEVRTQRELYAGLVIAGAGGAGMTAAAEAVREGGATVLVLEQQDIIGGETLYEPVLTLSDGTLTSGYGMLGDLRAEVEEAGAELLTGVKLTGLEVTDGRVTGVRAESADTDYLIHAQYGVILATGDYGGNPELVLAGAGETTLAEGLQEHFRTLSRGSSDGSGLTAALEAGAAAILMILVALIFRACGVLLCMVKTNLNAKERLFCVLAYLPKATVQAAIGSVPLAAGLGCGKIILSVAVMAIIITAPFGAFGMDMSYKKLLEKE